MRSLDGESGRATTVDWSRKAGLCRDVAIVIDAGQAFRSSDLINWTPVACLLEPLYPAIKGEPAWPPLAMFKALLLAVWHDLSDVKLAEALADRVSFRRFCGFSIEEKTPERT